MRLLLVEDDPMLGSVLHSALLKQHYAVDWLKSAEEALLAVKNEKFNLIIMDLGLPNMSGIEAIKHIRNEGMTMPILVLTARDSISDKIKGLDSGADDYLLKPFDLNELLARLRALSRREQTATAIKIEYQDITLDTSTYQVTYQGQPVNLSRREYMLLELFLSHSRQVFTRQQLEESMYSWGEEVSSNSIEVHIHHLRKKLYSSLIATVRGVGYILENK